MRDRSDHTLSISIKRNVVCVYQSLSFYQDVNHFIAKRRQPVCLTSFCYKMIDVLTAFCLQTFKTTILRLIPMERA